MVLWVVRKPAFRRPRKNRVKEKFNVWSISARTKYKTGPVDWPVHGNAAGPISLSRAQCEWAQKDGKEYVVSCRLFCMQRYIGSPASTGT